jgi:hypothetical protein
MIFFYKLPARKGGTGAIAPRKSRLKRHFRVIATGNFSRHNIFAP